MPQAVLEPGSSLEQATISRSTTTAQVITPEVAKSITEALEARFNPRLVQERLAQIEDILSSSGIKVLKAERVVDAQCDGKTRQLLAFVGRVGEGQGAKVGLGILYLDDLGVAFRAGSPENEQVVAELSVALRERMQLEKFTSDELLALRSPEQDKAVLRQEAALFRESLLEEVATAQTPERSGVERARDLAALEQGPVGEYAEDLLKLQGSPILQLLGEVGGIIGLGRALGIGLFERAGLFSDKLDVFIRSELEELKDQVENLKRTCQVWHDQQSAAEAHVSSSKQSLQLKALGKLFDIEIGRAEEVLEALEELEKKGLSPLVKYGAGSQLLKELANALSRINDNAQDAGNSSAAGQAKGSPEMSEYAEKVSSRAKALLIQLNQAVLKYMGGIYAGA